MAASTNLAQDGTNDAERSMSEALQVSTSVWSSSAVPAPLALSSIGGVNDVLTTSPEGAASSPHNAGGRSARKRRRPNVETFVSWDESLVSSPKTVMENNGPFNSPTSARNSLGSRKMVDNRFAFKSRNPQEAPPAPLQPDTSQLPWKTPAIAQKEYPPSPIYGPSNKIRSPSFQPLQTPRTTRTLASSVQSFIKKFPRRLLSCICAPIVTHYYVHILRTRQRPAVYYLPFKVLSELLFFLFSAFMAVWPFLFWLRWHESIFGVQEDSSQNHFIQSFFSYFEPKFDDLVPLYIFMSVTSTPYFLLNLGFRVCSIVFWKLAPVMDLLSIGFSAFGVIWYLFWAVILWVFQLCMYIFDDAYDFAEDPNQDPNTMWIPPQHLIIMCGTVSSLMCVQCVLAQVATLFDLKLRRLYYHYGMFYPGLNVSKRVLREYRAPFLWKCFVFFCPAFVLFGAPPERLPQRIVGFMREKKRNLNIRRQMKRAMAKQRILQMEKHYIIAIVKGERISMPEELVDPERPMEESLEYASDEFTWTEIVDPVQYPGRKTMARIRQLKRRVDYEYDSSDYTWNEEEDDDYMMEVRRRRDDEETAMTFIDEDGEKKKIPHVIRKRHRLKRWEQDEKSERNRMRRKKKRVLADESDDTETEDSDGHRKKMKRRDARERRKRKHNYNSDEYTWSLTEDEHQDKKDIRKLRRKDNEHTDYTITEDTDEETIKLPVRVQRARKYRRRKMKDALENTEDEYAWTETCDSDGRMIRKRRRRDGREEDFTIIEDANGVRMMVPSHLKEKFGFFDLDALMRMVKLRVAELGEEGDQIVDEEQKEHTTDDSDSFTGSPSHDDMLNNHIVEVIKDDDELRGLDLEFTAIQHFEGGEVAEEEEEEEEDGESFEESSYESSFHESDGSSMV
mmetsp:Transcript_7426/g.27771  ORF Transcript_7426/g.27771 Transcript_7426/m.27771 type:complete len:902 (-) Transcript_7426:103-2808(-)